MSCWKGEHNRVESARTKMEFCKLEKGVDFETLGGRFVFKLNIIIFDISYQINISVTHCSPSLFTSQGSPSPEERRWHKHTRRPHF